MTDIEAKEIELKYANKQIKQLEHTFIDDIVRTILPVLVQRALEKNTAIDSMEFVAYDAYRLAALTCKARNKLFKEL